MVDAATGRPLRFGEMEQLGLVGPRWRGANTWGAYESIDELRNAIIDDYNDPNGEIARMNDLVEQLERDKVDDDIAWENHFSGDVPLPDDQLNELKARRKAREQEIKRLKREEQMYLSRKYLHDLTPGRADFGDRIEILGGLSAPAQKAVEEGVEDFGALIGSGTHLERRFRSRIEGEYWQDKAELAPGGTRTYAQAHFGGPAQRPTLTFSKSSGNSDFQGGGQRSAIRIGNPVIADVIHEMGHWYEATSSGKMRSVVDFLRTRVGADEWGSPTPFLNATHRAEYEAALTRFLKPYQGSVYAGRQQWGQPALTETFSVGLQYFATRTYDMARFDPATFEFMCRILTGRL
jgi:hypothetical protein